MEQLAICGGKPVRENKIYYGRQCVDEDDVKAVSEVLTSNYISAFYVPFYNKSDQFHFLALYCLLSRQYCAISSSRVVTLNFCFNFST